MDILGFQFNRVCADKRFGPVLGIYVSLFGSALELRLFMYFSEFTDQLIPDLVLFIGLHMS